MDIRRGIYYILFLGIILGSFASMARNDYGLELVSTCCYLFAISFLLELIIVRSKKGFLLIAEHLSLALLFVLFGMRAAYIYLPYLEVLVAISCLSLATAYSLVAMKSGTEILSQNRQFGAFILSYYAGIIIFLLSIFLRSVNANLSMVLGVIGGGLLGLFILGVLYRRIQLVDGTEVDMLKHVRSRKHHASILATGFLFMSTYVGLNMLDLLPPLYTDEVPEAYIELVSDAESGGEESVDGVYRHNKFEEELNKFLERHGDFYSQ